MSTKYFTNEIVGLLKTYAPEKLGDLRKRFPSLESSLEEGITMGVEPVKKSLESIETVSSKGVERSETKNEEIQFRLELCKEGLESILVLCDQFVPKLKKKLLRLKNTQLISQVLIAISGASIIAMLGKENSTFNLIAASLAILGSLLTIFIQHQSTGIGEKSQNLSNYFTQLVALKTKAERQLLEIKIHKKFSENADQKELTTLVNESNSLCEDVREILLFLA